MRVLAACLLLVATATALENPATPREVLLRVALTENYDDVEYSLANDVLEPLKRYDRDLRQQWLGLVLMVGEAVRSQGGSIQHIKEGPVLLRIELPASKERIDVVLDREDVREQTALMEATLRSYIDGKEVELSRFPTYVGVYFKREGNEWKIIRVMTTSPIPLGDTTMLDNLARARIARNNTAAVQAIRWLNSAFIEAGTKGHECRLSSLAAALEEVAPAEVWARLRDSLMINGISEGYRFVLRACTKDGKYDTAAEPLEFGRTGSRAWCSDQTGIIYFADDGKAETCLKERKPLR